MKKTIIQSFKMFLFITILAGLIYPFVILLIGQIIFPYQANGSLIVKDGKVIGNCSNPANACNWDNYKIEKVVF